MEESTQQQQQLQTIQNQNVSIFNGRELFDHSQRVAKMLGESALIPKDYQKNIPNCMIALEMAQRIGASPLMVMQNLYIVHGKPAWSSQFLIATVNASGNFSPLRYEESDKEGGSTRAYATDKATGEVVYGAWVSMNMANAEGWVNKTGSKWKTMPELMRRYRAAAFFARQFAPELSMGIQTHEEIIDITPIQVVDSKPNGSNNKAELTPDHILFKGYVDGLKMGSVTIEAIKSRHHLNPEVEALLIEESKK